MSQSLEAQVGDVKAPDFLTSSYFESILRKFIGDDCLKVHSVVVKPFGGVGDAFASTMYRVKVCATQTENGKIRRGSYIVKMLPTLQLARDKLGAGNYNVHEKEMDIFQNIFPRFSRFLKPIGEEKNVFPKAIAVDKVKETLILEDLADKKFIMADRKVGLDENHLKLALQKLAAFHAASMIFMEQKPKLFAKYDVGMFSEKTSAFHDFFLSNMDALTEEVSSWEGFENYAKKLKRLKKSLLSNAARVFDNKEGGLKVLIHGDLWVNNLMFQYDQQGKPTDAILLDFQFCCVAHPAVDLLYFLFTSSIDEIRQTKIIELTQFYYYKLKDILIKSRFDVPNLPTLHQFQLQVMEKYFYAFPSSMLILPLMMSDDPESNFENSHQTDERALAFKRRLYKNEKLQKIIKNSLPRFDQLGLLDAM